MMRNTLLPAICLSLLACGGGGGSTATTPPPAPADTLLATEARFSGTINNASGAPLAGVKINLPYRTGAYTATTDAAGQYSFKVRTADFATGGIIALRAYADTFAPAAYYYQLPLQGKSTYNLGATPVALTPLGPNEYASAGFSELIHLGDDNYSGSQNSQLQTTSRGDGFSNTLLEWKTADNNKFKTARVKLLIRGMQGTTQTTKGDAGLFDAAGNAIGARVALNMNSDVAGGYSAYTFDYAVPATLPAGAVRFVVRTGSQPGDLDDIEYTGISLQFL